MNERLPRWRIVYVILWGFAVLSLGGSTYLVSYAPYLRLIKCTESSTIPYRSPIFYRGAEWFLVKVPPARPILMWWAGYVDVEDEMGIQIWFFTQGISDLSEMDFHIIAN